MSYFSEQQISTRQKKIISHWQQILSKNQGVAIFSGDFIHKPGGLDQTYPFNPNPSYYWITGHRRHSGIWFFSESTGPQHFMLPISRDEVIWEGASPLSNSHTPLNQWKTFIKAANLKNLFVLGSPSLTQISDISCSITQNLSIVDSQDLLSDNEKTWFELKKIMDQIRRKKDSEEIRLIEKVSAIAQVGYESIHKWIRPGVTEQSIRAVYECDVLKAGASGFPYESIVGAGDRSAVLHAIPTDRVVHENDLILIDAGAEIDDYCVDITRIFFAQNKPSFQQTALFDLVEKAQLKSFEKCKPGIVWNQVHQAAAYSIADDLFSLQIAKVKPEDFLSSGAISVFFPHGVGHLVGLRVRDTGHEENLKPKQYFGARLRVDIVLESDHLLTVEPGCYFISALLSDPAVRQQYNDQINFDEAAKWINVGGIRLEDDILIQSNGFKNLTSNITKRFH